jgi:AcrR family transcriptional regulator
MTNQIQHHGNRHGRSEQARLAVLEAADDLLAENGFAALTVEGIAVRAGVAKQTIYRWWPSKTDILFDAFVVDADEHFSDADHGDLGRDLIDHLSQLAVLLTRADSGAVFRALAGQAQHDPIVAARFQADVVERQRERDRAPFLRARNRRELPRGFDVEAAIDELTGPIYYRVLMTSQPVSKKLITDLVRHQLPAC